MGQKSERAALSCCFDAVQSAALSSMHVGAILCAEVGDSPVHTPSPVPVSQLMQMRRYVLHALEGVDHDVVDHVAPQHDVAPGGHPLPLVGCAKPPGLQDVLQVAVLVLDGSPVLLPGQVLEDVGALAELCQLLEAGKKRNGGHDADLGHLPPPVGEDEDKDEYEDEEEEVDIRYKFHVSLAGLQCFLQFGCAYC